MLPTQREPWTPRAPHAREMAGDHMLVGVRRKRRFLGRADIARFRAPCPQPAARARVQWAWRIAGGRNPMAAMVSPVGLEPTAPRLKVRCSHSSHCDRNSSFSDVNAAGSHCRRNEWRVAAVVVFKARWQPSSDGFIGCVPSICTCTSRRSFLLAHNADVVISLQHRSDKTLRQGCWPTIRRQQPSAPH
jgi:hypothetical protein